MKNSKELKKPKSVPFWGRIKLFRLISVGLSLLFIGIADFLLGFWQETSLVRESALLFRSELAQLQIPTHHMVPNINHEYWLTERPVNESLVPANSTRRLRTNNVGEIINDEVNKESLGSALKILFLGGSTTESNEVDEPFRFPTLVGKKLSERIGHKVVGLNGGVRGHTTQESINLLLNHPTYHKADVVVLMHNINDRLFLSEKGTYKTYLSSSSPTSWVSVEKSAKDFYHNLVDFVSYRSNILFLIKKNVLHVNPWTGEKTGLIVDEQVLDYPDRNFGQSISLFSQNLKFFLALAQEGGQIPILMTQPLGKFSWFQSRFNEEIRKVALTQKVNLIDLDKVMEEERQLFFYSDQIHFTNSGSIKIAQIIVEYLMPLLSRSLNDLSILEGGNGKKLAQISDCLPPPSPNEPYTIKPGPRHVLLGSYGRYPVMSPEENYILFQTQINGHSRIQIFDREKIQYIDLTAPSEPYDDRHPAILLQKSFGDFGVIFGSKRSGVEKLFLWDMTTKNIVPLPNIPKDLSTSIPSVSPDGTIFFAGYGEDSHSKFNPVPDLFSINPNDGYRIIQITNTKWEEWRPVFGQGEKFVYHIANPKGDFDIYKVPVKGGKSIVVYRSDKDEWDPDISKDGNWLVFASKQNGNFDLFLMDLTNSKSPVQLTHEITDDWDPRFLPISHSIVFASGEEHKSAMYFLCPFGEG